MRGSKAKLAFVTFLTLARFPLVMIFFVLALIHTHPAYRGLDVFALALGSLIASAVTDIYDGYFARKFNVITKFGAHADPLMDKFYYVATLPLLVFVATRNQHMAHAIFLLITTVLFLMRDQWVTFLRSIGSMYDVSGSADWSGKLRTIINFPMICTVYFYEESGIDFFPALAVHAFEGLAFAVNLVSIYTYTRRYWPYLRKSAEG